jgi:hypothetical protein
VRSSPPRTIRFGPGPGSRPDGRRRHRRLPWARLAAALGLAIVLGVGAVWTNVLGAGERFANLMARVELFLDPPPDRPTRPTVTVTEPPAPTPSPTPRPTPRRSLPPDATPTPPPTPSPTPARVPVDRDIVTDHAAVFASEITTEWCAPAGVQMTLAVLGLADTSEAFQRTLVNRIDEWEAWADSHNGNWGPAAMVQALEAYGATGYEIRAYDSRGHALADSARAIDATRSPVILLAWRGAHTWVMTGYRATADPSIFADAKVTGTYILDPWYPRKSSIWGQSDPPGTFQDEAEMERNFLKWARPEGRYPDRDGKFIVLIPTLAR